MANKILVPLDNCDTSRQTVATILKNSTRFPLPLVLLHVIDVDRLAYRMIPDFQLSMVKETATAAGERFLADQLRLFRNAGLHAEARLEQGTPPSSIVRIANEEDFQLLIIGRHSKGEIRDVLFGSVTNYVVHKVNCPILLL